MGRVRVVLEISEKRVKKTLVIRKLFVYTIKVLKNAHCVDTGGGLKYQWLTAGIQGNFC